MIAVVVSKAKRSGLFEWSVRHPVVANGRARDPLFQACRVLKSMGVPAAAEIGMFHKLSDMELTAWTLKTTVGHGATLTVEDKPMSSGVRFIPYRNYTGPEHE